MRLVGWVFHKGDRLGWFQNSFLFTISSLDLIELLHYF
jgi:hypothetical protein